MPNPTPRRIHTPWQVEVEKIERLIEENRRSPEYQRQRDWYWANHAIDLDAVVKTPGFSVGFHAGMLYAQCETETGTAPSAEVDGG